jgi:hypothetical protein
MSFSPRNGWARLLASWMAGTANVDLRRARASVAERERGRACAK